MNWSALPRLLSCVTAFICSIWLPQMTHAQSTNSVVIWPIDPIIENRDRSTSVWIENPGNQPIFLQVRIFGWTQDGNENRVTEQADITGTPPLIRVEPAQRQLIRLTRLVPPQPGQEKAYRVIIDEIPQSPAGAATDQTATKAGAAIQFRMRYSLPLYVYGRGIGSKAYAPALPRLEWRNVQSGNKPAIEIRNIGSLHGKLTSVSARRPDGSVIKLDTVSGHVLPGAVMRWIANAAVPDNAVLDASINGAPSTIIPHWAP